ncbi:MAG: DUF3299 domain-containing protein [Betaproteobacteria bacterium]|nr:DUF3299 domain-containing protein [Betaproteobacteria bacterium]
MIARPRCLLLLIGALLTVTVFAEEPRQVMWADLVPKAAAFDNPFLKLTPEQLARVSDVAAIRDRRERGDKNLSRAEIESEPGLVRKLEQAGVDVDGLLAKRKEIIERGRTVNPLLNGQTVRLPGYLLPLEFSGKQVSEFLLVPWVGACIHTPPPPPNQIVHVKPEKPVEMSGIFAPVWVTGQMTTGSIRKSLSLVDGSADIDVGYSLQASRVEPYKE